MSSWLNGVEISNIKLQNLMPERSEFCQIETLKTWVPKEYHNTDRMELIKKWIIESHLLNPKISTISQAIINNHGETRSFGITNPLSSEIQLLCLRHIHKLAQEKDNSWLGLEIGAGDGRAFSLLPIAANGKGKWVINDLSTPMIEKAKKILKERLTDAEYKTVVQNCGDCFQILSNYPKVKNRFKVILSMHVTHFFNPVQHTKFVQLISDSLAVDGKAFIIALCVKFYEDENHIINTYYQSQKEKKSLYPGFMRTETIIEQTSTGQTISNRNIIKVEQPENDAICGAKKIKELPKEFSRSVDLTQSGKKDLTRTVLDVGLFMRFTPDMIKQIYSQDPTLVVEDAFYTDPFGNRQNKPDALSEFCACVIKKVK